MSRLRQCALASFSLGLALLPAPSLAHASPAPVDSNQQLSECLTDGDRPLAVLFLVDTSQSLRVTDPGVTPGRVRALEGALRALDTVAASRPVNVDFLEFGTGATRSFPDIPAWISYAERADEFRARIDSFADRNTSEDTDYAIALQQAGVALSSAPGNACRLVAWFTDGELDIDFQGRPKQLTWAEPPIEIQRESDEEPAELRAMEAICRPGGFADQLRPETGKLSDGGAFVAAVAFGDSQQFDRLREIVTNPNGDCGQRSPSGSVVLTENFDKLTSALIRGVDPAPPDATDERISLVDDERCSAPLDPGNPGAFRIPTSVTSMRVRTETPDRDVVPVLLGPTADTPLRFDNPGSYVVADGADVTIAPLSPLMASVSLTFPDQVGAWAGDWELRFCTTNPERLGATGTVEVLDVSGDVSAELRSFNAVRRGRSGEAVVQLVGATGQVLSADAVGGAGTWSLAATANSLDLSSPTLEPDGTIRAQYDVPEDFADDSLSFDVALDPVVEVFPPGRAWPLESARLTVGPVEVRNLPQYPIVGTPTAFPELDQEHRTSGATLLVESVGAESAGCVQVTDAQVSGPDPAGSYQLVVLEDGNEIGAGICPIDLAADSQRTFDVVIEIDEAAARSAGKVSGELRFRSTSALDPAQDEDFTFEFSARVDPLLVVTSPETEVVLGLLIASMLAPILLLYLYNYVWGARVDVVSSPVVSVPLRITGGSVERADGAGSSHPAVYETDIRAWPQQTGRTKRIDVRGTDGGALLIEAHASWWPWGNPHATAKAAGRQLHIGPQGSDRRFRRAKTPMSTSRLWVFAGDIPEETAAGKDGEPVRATQGIVTIFPRRGRAIEDANDLLHDAIERVLSVVESSEVPVITPEPPITDSPPEDPTQPAPKRPIADDDWDTRRGGTGASDSWDDPGPAHDDQPPY